MFPGNRLATIVLCICALYTNFTQAEFPTDPKPCKHGDSECLTKIISYFLREKFEGDKTINLVKIDPLKISKISIKQGADSPVNIDLEFSDNEVKGIHTAKVLNVKGFGQDLTEKHEIHFKFDRVSLLGNYKISGRILLLPISGTGKSNITMVDTNVALMFSGTKYEKDGETYMKVNNMDIIFTPGRFYYYFGNLFNGDKDLGDGMNAFLNENWKDIFNEVKGSISKAFSKVFESILNTVFEKYPYNKYFIES